MKTRTDKKTLRLLANLALRYDGKKNFEARDKILELAAPIQERIKLNRYRSKTFYSDTKPDGVRAYLVGSNWIDEEQLIMA